MIADKSLKSIIKDTTENFQKLKLIIPNLEKTQTNFNNPNPDYLNIVKNVKVLQENIIKGYNFLKQKGLEEFKKDIIFQFEKIKKGMNKIKLNEISENLEIIKRPEDANLKSLYLEYKKIKKHFNTNKENLLILLEFFYESFYTIYNFLENLPKRIDKNIINDESIKSDEKDYNKKIFKYYIKNVKLFYEFTDILTRIKNKIDEFKDLSLYNLKEELENYNNNIKDNNNAIEKNFKTIEINLNAYEYIFNFVIKYLIELKDNLEKNFTKLIKNIFTDYIKSDNMRLDILIILDTTNSMGDYKKELENNFKEIIKEIKNECYLSLLYIGFIGYKDFYDLNLGEEYVDIDLTQKTKNIFEEIKKVNIDGGDDVPEDIAGAFEMALKKSWGNNTKIIFLITDSPCHGEEYHNFDQNKTEFKDNYKDGDKNRRKMKDLVNEFAQKDINLVCFNLCEYTDIMFNKFKQIYKDNNKSNLFSVEKGKLKEIIVKKTSEIFKKKEKFILEDFESLGNNK